MWDAERRVVVGIGSNLGDRIATVLAGSAALRALPGIRSSRLSHLYETEPVGGPAQGDYVNAAVVLHTALKASSLLRAALEIERRHGRVRGERYGPRTLDLDILWIEGERIDTPLLSVPHPQLHARPFALAPLVDVAPDATDPTTGERYADRLRALGLRGVRRMCEPDDFTKMA